MAKETILPDNMRPNAEAIIIPMQGAASIKLILVEEGSFMMGSNEGESCEKPIHKVTLNGFYMAETPVTIGQFMAFCKETNQHWPEWMEEGSDYNINIGDDDHYKMDGITEDSVHHPIVGVCWNDAMAFCEWLNEKTGIKLGLPTEAQWEYAARGGTKKKGEGFRYAGGNNLSEVAWSSENSDGNLKPVGKKMPNELGLYDMSGNVWEWCYDWYDENYYQNSPNKNPFGPEMGSSRVLRGGSWGNSADYCRVAYRYPDVPSGRDRHSGFRVCSVPQ